MTWLLELINDPSHRLSLFACPEAIVLLGLHVVSGGFQIRITVLVAHMSCNGPKITLHPITTANCAENNISGKNIGLVTETTEGKRDGI